MVYDSDRMDDEAPVIGDSRGIVDLVGRTVAGLPGLLLYGAIGTIEQAIVAPFSGQIPIVGGFTLAIPGVASSTKGYTVGVRGQSQDFQTAAHLRGQEVIPGIPLRTHTTGILDYAVRHGLPFSRSAIEIPHPGRTRQIEYEASDPSGGALLASLCK